MTRLAPIGLAMMALVMVSGAAFAQGSNSGAGGSSAASSAGSASGATTGSVIGRPAAGTGSADVTGAGSVRGGSGDRDVDAKDRAVDTKIKSICKGC